MLLGTQASQIRVLELESWFCFQFYLPPDMHHGRQEMAAYVAGNLPLHRFRFGSYFLPGLDPAVIDAQDITQQMGAVYLSVFEINKKRIFKKTHFLSLKNL